MCNVDISQKIINLSNRRHTIKIDFLHTSSQLLSELYDLIRDGDLTSSVMQNIFEEIFSEAVLCAQSDSKLKNQN